MLKNNNFNNGSFVGNILGSGAGNPGILAIGSAFYNRNNEQLRTFTTSQDTTVERNGIPNGATHPASWMLPTKPGGIASYTTTITSSASAATTPPTVVNRTASANVAATGSGTLTATARIFTDLEFIRRGLGPYTVDVYNI